MDVADLVHTLTTGSFDASNPDYERLPLRARVAAECPLLWRPATRLSPTGYRNA